MKKLKFKSTEEFESAFYGKNKQVTDAIVESIREAMQFQKRSALLFDISFEDHDVAYEISLPKSQWETALQSCLDHYHSINSTDDCIDTWQLKEDLKNW